MLSGAELAEWRESAIGFRRLVTSDGMLPFWARLLFEHDALTTALAAERALANDLALELDRLYPVVHTGGPVSYEQMRRIVDTLARHRTPR